VPGVYPDPVEVIDPVNDWMLTSTVPPVPPPPSRVIVGLVSYPSPTPDNTAVPILPVASSNVRVIDAAEVGVPDITTVGIFL
jgi:hypothetical protein